MSDQRDPFAPAVHRAHEWLAVVDEVLATGDRATAYRILRAWLHTVRDRLSVVTAASFSAQLPELLRGTFFEGWQPSRVPASHRASAFTADFAAAADVEEHEVPALAGLVTEALAELFSPGQLEHVFTTLPLSLRRLLTGRAPAVPGATSLWPV